MVVRHRSSKKNVRGRLRIAVLMGGPSAEYEISLLTGKNVLKNLDKRKYQTQAVIVSKSGLWPFPVKELKPRFDLVFVAMHGQYGEDGTVQKILEKLKIPFTGSGSKASQLGMDKEKSLKIFEKAGLLAPPSVNKLQQLPKVGLPMVIKPTTAGSSVGVSIVQNYQQLAPALKLARSYSSRFVAQKFISGREFTCGVIEQNGNLAPLLPIEILPRVSSFFDYQAKYSAGGSEELCPPKSLNQKQISQLQQLAVKAHRAIGCRGYSRADFILADDSRFYILEINTLPGLTEASLVPKAAQAVGISFPELLDIIIQSSL